MKKRNEIVIFFVRMAAAWPTIIISAALGIVSLFVMSAMKTNQFTRMIPEHLEIRLRNVPLALLGTFIMLVVLAFLAASMQNCSYRMANCITALAAVESIALCLWWMNSFVNTPQADQANVWHIAQTLASSEKATQEESDYLFLHPYQSGMAMVMEAVIRLNGESWKGWQIVNMLCVAACIVFLSCLCGRITDSHCAKAICAVLLICFVPLCMYSTFIYGSVPGMTTSFAVLYMLSRLSTARRTRLVWLILMVLTATVSIILYSANQIFLVAVSLVLLAMGLTDRSNRALIPISILFVILPLFFCKSWQAIAMLRLGLENTSGIPMLARLAMGVDAFTTERPGFYNCLNVNLYVKCNYDPVLTSHEALQHIKKSLIALEEEGRLLNFFGIKISDQWLDSWYGALAMTDASLFDEPGWLARSLTDGTLYKPVQAFLRALLTIIYLTAAGGTAGIAHRFNRDIWRLSTAVCLTGGFIFQIIYEAKSRYCLPYFLCCFPLAAAGLTWMAPKIRMFLKKIAFPKYERKNLK